MRCRTPAPDPGVVEGPRGPERRGHPARAVEVGAVPLPDPAGARPLPLDPDELAAGAPPGADDLADAAPELGLRVEPALERLSREDLVHHDPETGAIVVAYPFSGRPAAHRVRFDGREAYAMCAIDALGFPFMLGVAAEVESRDPLGDDAIRVEVDPSAGARGRRKGRW